MKFSLIALILVSVSSFAAGPQTVAADGSNVTLAADGTCSLSGFAVQPSENAKETGQAICKSLGLYNLDAGMAQITGTYGGSYRAAADINPSVCRIDSSGVDANAATCGNVNP